MQDLINIKTMKPFGAKGHVCIDYKDPVTGKIKEQVKGDNHVFEEAMFLEGWYTELQTVSLYLSDSRRPIDPNFPYLLGNPIGYGMPGQAGSGAYMGAYNSTLSFLATQTSEGVFSKYVYEFLPSQALGNVGSISLSNQFGMNAGRTRNPFKRRKYPSTALSGATLISVGHFLYSIDNNAVVSRINGLDGTVSQINVSATVGTGTSRWIGYAPTTGHFYIRVYSSTAANRRMYEFSDDSFTTLLNTWSPTNDTREENFYVYGGKAFSFNALLYKSDFVNNTTPTSVDIPVPTAWGSTGTGGGSSATYGTLFLAFCSSSSGGNLSGYVFDMASEEVAGYVGRLFYNDTKGQVLIKDPNYPSLFLAANKTTSAYYTFYALAANTLYRVPDGAPERPAGYGMTITYELGVLY